MPPGRREMPPIEALIVVAVQSKKLEQARNGTTGLNPDPTDEILAQTAERTLEHMYQRLRSGKSAI